MRYVLLILALLLTGACTDETASGVNSPSIPESSAPAQTTEEVAPTPPRSVILAADPWCPHNCKAGSEQEGYMVDLARKIFTDAGYHFEYRNYGWARSLREARENRIDGVIGALKGDAPDFVFHQASLGTVTITLYTRPDSDWLYNTLSDLDGKRLLAINGYSYSPELDRYILKHSGDPQRVWLLTGAAPLERALKLLTQDRADVFPEDRAVMNWFIRQHPSVPQPRPAGVAHRAPIHIAFSPGDPESRQLAELIDEGLSRLSENGELERVMASYGVTD